MNKAAALLKGKLGKKAGGRGGLAGLAAKAKGAGVEADTMSGAPALSMAAFKASTGGKANKGLYSDGSGAGAK